MVVIGKFMPHSANISIILNTLISLIWEHLGTRKEFLGSNYYTLGIDKFQLTVCVHHGINHFIWDSNIHGILLASQHRLQRNKYDLSDR